MNITLEEPPRVERRQTTTALEPGAAPGSVREAIQKDDALLVTGAGGFIGRRVVRRLLESGFTRVRCMVRPSGDVAGFRSMFASAIDEGRAEVFIGNLLSREDCRQACERVTGIFHLAAGTGTKSFPDAYMNSVVTTRNLIEAALEEKCLKRFVSLSSFAVYTNRGHSRRNILDETSEVETNPETRYEAYCYAKVKQDELIAEYGTKQGLPFVLLRPGLVYGPGKNRIPGRVGSDALGIFLEFGGSGKIPFTYVDNCAAAVVLAGQKPGIEGEVFNIVDDDLPSSREFLRLYKKNVAKVRSVPVPQFASYLFCWAWEAYSKYSEEQIPAVFTRREWRAFWKATQYSNEKLKKMGWTPEISTKEGLKRFFESCGKAGKN